MQNAKVKIQNALAFPADKLQGITKNEHDSPPSFPLCNTTCSHHPSTPLSSTGKIQGLIPR
jgi:hypothetical protein